MPRSRAAMSFTEIIISVLVMAVGLIPALIVLSRGNVGTQMTRDEILAHQYAAELVTYAQALGYEKAGAVGLPDQDIRTITIGGTTTTLPDGFSRFLSVAEVKPEVADWPRQIRIIRVKITWRTGQVAQQFILTGLLQKGMGKP